jgi:hypothetical protein
MKHWSYITNPSPNCRRYLLRTNRHACFLRSTWPNMMTPTKCHQYQANEGKTGAALKSMCPAKLACQLRAKTHALRKSP